MSELPRFEPLQDSRPVDEPWPSARWPIAADVVLEGQAVRLSQSTADDAEELLASLDQEAAWQYLPFRAASPAEMREQLVQRLGDPSWHCWTVRLREPRHGLPAGAVVGTTSYLDTHVESARTEIGATQYSPSVWGTRVNPECKLALLSYAFDELHMGRVQVKTDVRNVRSQQAIARLGAKYEGVLRRYQRRADGSVRDTVLFSIIAEDWPDVRARLEQRLSQAQ